MEENIEKKRRGRPRKVKLSDDDMFDEIFMKAYDFKLEDGELKVCRSPNVLTLDETAFMVWYLEGKKTAKPLSKVMMIKTEQSALKKLRNGLAKFGIKKFDDVYDGARMRSCAKLASKFDASDAPE